MNNELAKLLYDIINDYHKRYGQSKYDEVEWVDYTVIFYGLCTFFSMDKDEVITKIKTPAMVEEYYVTKNAVARKFADGFKNNNFDMDEMNKFLHKYFGIVYNSVKKEEEIEEEPNLFFSIDDITIMFTEVESRDGCAYEYILKIASLCVSKLKDYLPYRYIIESYKDVIVSEVQPYEKAKEKSTASTTKTISEIRTYLKENLREKIKGQDIAIDKFVDSYIRYKVRGAEPGKPAAVSLFAGPPGTGKTYLAETFTKLLKEEGYAYKRFDMSAYGGDGADNVTGLVGFESTWKAAAPGQLTDFVRRNPKCVLLFDEIEKAGKQVRLLFLSVLEGAVLRDRYYDSQISFEDAIIIFTTNEGKELYEDNYKANLSAMNDMVVIDALKDSEFPPELLSRFAAGNVIMFNHLNFSHMMGIFNVNLADAIKKLQNANGDFQFKYDEKLLPKLYLFNKAGQVDARFVSANVKRYAEEQYIKLVEVAQSKGTDINSIKKISVAVDVGDTVKEYFKQKEKPRILCCDNGDTLMHKKEIQKYAKVEWAKNVDELREKLDSCNWNSDDSKDKYQAFIINLFGQDDSNKSYVDTEGYRCLLHIENECLDVPMLVEDNISDADAMKLDLISKNALRHHGVTDFVDVCSNELREVFDRYHFVDKITELSDNNKRMSADISYEYIPKNKEMKLTYVNLHIEKATEELAADRSMNKRYLLDKKPKVSLKDIFGNKLAKDAVKRCIDNIKHPEKYTAVGAKLMKGILMYGAPGMGKTMFAKAMAYESGAEFISTVGADFMKDNGVDKVEEIFKTARRKKPCIIFIDEFDAISKLRGHISNYEEKVLEKFLKEMDGLETDNDGVYVVGATNYDLEGLDPAITRRFSSKIYFPYPSKEERLQFILHILKKKGLEGVISEKKAKTLNLMMYGRMNNYAEIETFFEESIAEAVYKGIAVSEKFLFNRIHNDTDGEARSEENIERLTAVAFHEAGHAVLQWHYGRKNEYVTIVSRGGYGGYAMADSKLRTKKEFLEQIRISMAGRAAELLRLSGNKDQDDSEILDTGAYSDLQKATSYAYQCVARYGFGTRFTVVPSWLAEEKGKYPEDVLSDEEKKKIWSEVEDILKREWENTKANIRELFELVKVVAISLIYLKELDGEAIEKIITSKVPLVDESCFEDIDFDYATSVFECNDDDETQCSYGFPIYPRSVIKVNNYENDIYDIGEKKYYYAVKSAKESFGMYEDIREALEVAYVNGASCRRFIRKTAAKEYLDMLELRVCIENGESSVGFKVDAMDEIKELHQVDYEVRVLKKENVLALKKSAANKGMSLDEYFVNELVNKELLDATGDLEILYQIHDKELKRMLIGMWD